MYIMIALTYSGIFSGIQFFPTYYDFIKSKSGFVHYTLYELDTEKATIKQVEEK